MESVEAEYGISSREETMAAMECKGKTTVLQSNEMEKEVHGVPYLHDEAFRACLCPQRREALIMCRKTNDD
jgi:hypothetical protein